MAPLHHDELSALVNAFRDKLHGDWLLIGGALVALWLDPKRETEDVDLIPMGGGDSRKTELISTAFELGVSIEVVNSAADFFLHRIDGWEQGCELFLTGPAGRIFRPSPTVFLLLKIGRLSTQDLADCETVIKHAKANMLPIDRDRVLAALRKLPAVEDLRIGKRRKALEALLEAA